MKVFVEFREHSLGCSFVYFILYTIAYLFKILYFCYCDSLKNLNLALTSGGTLYVDSRNSDDYLSRFSNIRGGPLVMTVHITES